MCRKQLKTMPLETICETDQLSDSNAGREASDRKEETSSPLCVTAFDYQGILEAAGDEEQEGVACFPNELRRKTVDFAPEVSMMLIPHRFDYDDDVRSSLWSSRHELGAMAARNFLEFAAEGRDWRNATEEDEMMTLNNGEKVHPVHYDHLLTNSMLHHIPYPRTLVPVILESATVREIRPSIDERVLLEHEPSRESGDCQENRDDGAVCYANVFLERPSSPFLGQSDDEEIYGENESFEFETNHEQLHPSCARRLR